MSNRRDLKDKVDRMLSRLAYDGNRYVVGGNCSSRDPSYPLDIHAFLQDLADRNDRFVRGGSQMTPQMTPQGYAAKKRVARIDDILDTLAMSNKRFVTGGGKRKKGKKKSKPKSSRPIKTTPTPTPTPTPATTPTPTTTTTITTTTTKEPSEGRRIYSPEEISDYERQHANEVMKQYRTELSEIKRSDMRASDKLVQIRMKIKDAWGNPSLTKFIKMKRKLSKDNRNAISNLTRELGLSDDPLDDPFSTESIIKDTEQAVFNNQMTADSLLDDETATATPPSSEDEQSEEISEDEFIPEDEFLLELAKDQALTRANHYVSQINRRKHDFKGKYFNERRNVKKDVKGQYLLYKQEKYDEMNLSLLERASDDMVKMLKDVGAKYQEFNSPVVEVAQTNDETEAPGVVQSLIDATDEIATQQGSSLSSRDMKQLTIAQTLLEDRQNPSEIVEFVQEASRILKVPEEEILEQTIDKLNEAQQDEEFTPAPAPVPPPPPRRFPPPAHQAGPPPLPTWPDKLLEQQDEEFTPAPAPVPPSLPRRFPPPTYQAGLPTLPEWFDELLEQDESSDEEASDHEEVVRPMRSNNPDNPHVQESTMPGRVPIRPLQRAGDPRPTWESLLLPDSFFDTPPDNEDILRSIRERIAEDEANGNDVLAYVRDAAAEDAVEILTDQSRSDEHQQAQDLLISAADPRIDAPTLEGLRRMTNLEIVRDMTSQPTRPSNLNIQPTMQEVRQAAAPSLNQQLQSITQSEQSVPPGTWRQDVLDDLQEDEAADSTDTEGSESASEEEQEQSNEAEEINETLEQKAQDAANPAYMVADLVYGEDNQLGPDDQNQVYNFDLNFPNLPPPPPLNQMFPNLPPLQNFPNLPPLQNFPGYPLQNFPGYPPPLPFLDYPPDGPASPLGSSPGSTPPVSPRGAPGAPPPVPPAAAPPAPVDDSLQKGLAKLIDIFSGEPQQQGYQPQPVIRGDKSKAQKALDFLVSQAEKEKPKVTNTNSDLAMKLNNQLRKRAGLRPRKRSEEPGLRAAQGPEYEESEKDIPRRSTPVVKLRTNKLKKELDAVERVQQRQQTRLEYVRCDDGSCNVQATRNKLELGLVKNKAAKQEVIARKDFGKTKKKEIPKKVKKASGSKTAAVKTPKVTVPKITAPVLVASRKVGRPRKGGNLKSKPITDYIPEEPEIVIEEVVAVAKVRQPSPWNVHVAKTAKRHPGKPFQELIKIAKSTYKK